MPTIRKRGEKYQAIVRIKRAGVLVFQQSRVFTSHKLAREWGTKLEAQLLNEGVERVVSARLTLGSYLQQYVEYLEKATPERTKVIAALARLAEVFASTPLDAPAKVFVDYGRTRRDAGASAATLRHDLALLSSALGAGPAALGVRTSNRAVVEATAQLKSMRLAQPSQHRQRRVSDQELEVVCAILDGRQGHPSTFIPAAAIARLAVALPRRLGELTAMRWDDYDQARQIIRLRGTKSPRQVRDEVVAVPPQARAILAALPRVDERILPYKEGSISAAFARAVQRAGLDDLHFHDLRHEGITRLFEMGLDIPEVANISGHLNWQMLRRYTHLQAAQIAEKLNAYSQKTPDLEPA